MFTQNHSFRCEFPRDNASPSKFARDFLVCISVSFHRWTYFSHWGWGGIFTTWTWHENTSSKQTVSNDARDRETEFEN